MPLTTKTSNMSREGELKARSGRNNVSRIIWSTPRRPAAKHDTIGAGNSEEIRVLGLSAHHDYPAHAIFFIALHDMHSTRVVCVHMPALLERLLTSQCELSVKARTCMARFVLTVHRPPPSLYLWQHRQNIGSSSTRRQGFWKRLRSFIG